MLVIIEKVALFALIVASFMFMYVVYLFLEEESNKKIVLFGTISVSLFIGSLVTAVSCFALDIATKIL